MAVYLCDDKQLRKHNTENGKITEPSNIATHNNVNSNPLPAKQAPFTTENNDKKNNKS